MSDAAFKTAKYPSYTTEQLKGNIGQGLDLHGGMREEVARREAVAAGDWSQMTPGERLRYMNENLQS